MPRSPGLLRLVAGTLGGKAPVSPVSRRAQRAVLTEQAVRGVLELAVRIGEAMLSLGAAAAEITDVMRRTCRAFGVECQVDLTFTSILVGYDGGEDTPGVSVLRVVKSRTPDYDRLSQLMELAAEIRSAPGDARVDEAIDDPAVRDRARRKLEEIHRRIDDILLAPRRYRRFVVTLLLAAMAGGVALLLGGGPLVVIVAAMTTALIDLTVQLLARWGLPPFFLQIAGAAVATTVAVLILAVIPGLPLGLTALPPGLVVASGIVVLLAGMSLVGAADDAINGFPVTASGRLVEVMLLTLGIVIGIGGVLDIARRLGVEVALVDGFASSWPFSVQVLGAGIAAGAWAMSSYAGLRASGVAAALGAGAYLASQALMLAGLPITAASGLSALAVGFAAEALGARLRVPVIVLTVCGTVPLLPGLAIYRGMLDIATGESILEGADQLIEAAMIGVALAAGATLGEILAQRLGASPRELLPAHVRHTRLRRRRAENAAASAAPGGDAGSPSTAEQPATAAARAGDHGEKDPPPPPLDDEAPHPGMDAGANPGN